VKGIIHVHSKYSHDGKNSLEELVAFARGRRMGFIGLTDHAEDLTADTFAQLVDHCGRVSTGGIRIIPGLEYRFRGAPGLHLLALGLDRWTQPRTIEEFLNLTTPHAQLTVVAHPVLARHRIPPAVLDRIDAIEVWNGGYNTRYLPDPRSVRILHQVRRGRSEVVGTVGPDMHDCRNFRETSITVADGASEPLDEIREGRFYNEGKTMKFSPDVPWSSARLGLTTAARDALDWVNWTHDRVMRRLRPPPAR
jgi:hypothetical protein